MRADGLGEAGITLLQYGAMRLRPSVAAADQRILEPLSPSERELFIDMLIRMIGANGAYARPGAGRRKRGVSRSPPKHGEKPASYRT